MIPFVHDSDCGRHNEPALRNTACDCRLSKPVTLPLALLQAFIEIPLGAEVEDDPDMILYKNAGRYVTVGDVQALRVAVGLNADGSAA